MHTAEEVRKEAEDFLPWQQAKEMLLAYADLLEKRETEQRELSAARKEEGNGR